MIYKKNMIILLPLYLIQDELLNKWTSLNKTITHSFDEIEVNKAIDEIKKMNRIKRPCVIISVNQGNVLLLPITSKSREFLHLEIKRISEKYESSYVKLASLNTFSKEFLDKVCSIPNGDMISKIDKSDREKLREEIIRVNF